MSVLLFNTKLKANCAPHLIDECNHVEITSYQIIIVNVGCFFFSLCNVGLVVYMDGKYQQWKGLSHASALEWWQHHFSRTIKHFSESYLSFWKIDFLANMWFTFLITKTQTNYNCITIVGDSIFLLVFSFLNFWFISWVVVNVVEKSCFQ